MITETPQRKIVKIRRMIPSGEITTQIVEKIEPATTASNNKVQESSVEVKQKETASSLFGTGAVKPGLKVEQKEASPDKKVVL